MATLVGTYEAKLRVLVASRISDPFAVDEIVSEVVVTAWRRLEELPDDPSARWAWLRNAALNHCRNFVRGKVRRERLERHLVHVASRQVGYHDPAAVQPNAERLAAQAILRQLSDKDMSILLLVDTGIPHDRAAAQLGVGVGAFRMRLHRTRQRLESLLHELL